ncbi:MAG: alanine--tRNA ligase [Candidatus Aenigmatarchaeota archaeon]
MDSEKLKKLYIEFFKQKGHNVIPNASLIPENDPTVLFTTAGMHPLVPFLLGQPHPRGKRLVNVQKCFRCDDIDEIGDNRHLTFFEMLGNWSLGDYFKKEAIEWSFEFLTSILGLDPKRIYVSAFEGDENAPRDEESIKAWSELFKTVGIEPKVNVPLSEGGRIFIYDKKMCWWGPVGQTGPCGPNSEMFYDTCRKHNPKFGKVCHPSCDCGRFIEIWNDVFMEYNKKPDGSYEKLKQRNVDTGLGVDRVLTVFQGKETVFDTETFMPIIEKVKEFVNLKSLDESQKISIRIITDHIRAATFILAEKIVPKNVEHGYILRRLIRRAIRHGKMLGIEEGFLNDVAKVVIDINKNDYPHLLSNRDFILDELRKEELKFRKTLAKGLRKFNEISKDKKRIDGKNAFLLFQSYGFPIEMTVELAKENKIEVDVKGFEEEFEKHQKLSRAGAEKKFGSGLADTSKKTVRLHTATHLLNEALRKVLKKDIMQKGSNIKPERLRFDFNFDRKLTEKELKDVEDLVNEQIKKGIPVIKMETTVEEAKKMGAQAVFKEKYGEKVFVYSVGDFSCEICNGPHVKNTKELGKFKIVKEKSIASGVRRIRAVLED